MNVLVRRSTLVSIESKLLLVIWPLTPSIRPPSKEAPSAVLSRFFSNGLIYPWCKKVHYLRSFILIAVGSSTPVCHQYNHSGALSTLSSVSLAVQEKLPILWKCPHVRRQILLLCVYNVLLLLTNVHPPLVGSIKGDDNACIHFRHTHARMHTLWYCECGTTCWLIQELHMLDRLQPCSLAVCDDGTHFCLTRCI